MTKTPSSQLREALRAGDVDRLASILEAAAAEDALGALEQSDLYWASRWPLPLPLLQHILDELWVKSPADYSHELSLRLACAQGAFHHSETLRKLVESWAAHSRWCLELATSWGFQPPADFVCKDDENLEPEFQALFGSGVFGANLQPPDCSSSQLQRWREKVSTPGLIPHSLYHGVRRDRIEFSLLYFHPPGGSRPRHELEALFAEVEQFFRRELGDKLDWRLVRIEQEVDAFPFTCCHYSDWAANAEGAVNRTHPWRPKGNQVRIVLFDVSDRWTQDGGLAGGKQVFCRLGGFKHQHATLVAHELGHSLFELDDLAVDVPPDHPLTVMGYDWDGPLGATSLGYRYRAACLRTPEQARAWLKVSRLWKREQWARGAEQAHALWQEDQDFLAAGYLAISGYSRENNWRLARELAQQVLVAFPSRVLSSAFKQLLPGRFHCPLPRLRLRRTLDRARKIQQFGYAGNADKILQSIDSTESKTQESVNSLMYSLLNEGRLQEALGVARRWVEVAPLNIDAWTQLASVLCRCCQTKSAQKVMRICRKMGGEPDELKACWLLASGRREELLLLLQRRWDSTTWGTYWLIVWLELLIGLGREDQARELWKRHRALLSSRLYAVRWLKGESRQSLCCHLQSRLRGSFHQQLASLNWLAFLDPGGSWLEQRLALCPGMPCGLFELPAVDDTFGPLPWHPDSGLPWPESLQPRKISPPKSLELHLKLGAAAAAFLHHPSRVRILETFRACAPGGRKLRMEFPRRMDPLEYEISGREERSLRWRFRPGAVLAMGPANRLTEIAETLLEEPAARVSCAWIDLGRRDEAEAKGLLLATGLEVLLVQMAYVLRGGPPPSVGLLQALVWWWETRCQVSPNSFLYSPEESQEILRALKSFL